ncbi:MAG: PA14 domain-containing protein [Phycisphaerales bacterium]
MSPQSRSFLITALLLVSCTVACAQGLKGEYFASMTLSGEPVLTRTENVDFTWGTNSPGDPVPADAFSVRWTGSLIPPETGGYTFATRSDDGVRLWVGGDRVINNWTDHSSTLNTSQTISLDAGEPVSIQLEFYENGGDAIMQFYWSGPGFEQEIIPADCLLTTVATNLAARKPIPANGTLDFSPTSAIVKWTAGDTAMYHNVYFGTSPELTDANMVKNRLPLATTFYYHGAGLTPGTTYYWRVDEIEKDLATIHVGRVWSFQVQALAAYHPSPADGATDAPISPELTWLACYKGAEHHLYFSDSLDAVTEGTADADKGTFALADANFVPDTLDALTTYYWRVDETLKDGTLKTGEVWSFTTCLPVDDFESYTDNMDAGEALWQTWIDGLTNDTGSYVGYENANGGTFGEIRIVHSGGQSMPIDFNNVGEPYCSEVEREFESSQDWMIDDANTLVLYIRGRPANPATQLYVTLQDSSNHTATVVHPDSAITQAPTWTAWKIPLSEFAGVGAARVKKIYIGLGGKANPTQGGAGRIYIDDICITIGTL